MKYGKTMKSFFRPKFLTVKIIPIPKVVCISTVHVVRRKTRRRTKQTVIVMWSQNKVVKVDIFALSGRICQTGKEQYSTVEILYSMHVVHTLTHTHHYDCVYYILWYISKIPPVYGLLSFLLNFNSDFSLSLSLSQVHVKSLRPTPAIVESFV